MLYKLSDTIVTSMKSVSLYFRNGLSKEYAWSFMPSAMDHLVRFAFTSSFSIDKNECLVKFWNPNSPPGSIAILCFQELNFVPLDYDETRIVDKYKLETAKSLA